VACSPRCFAAACIAERERARARKSEQPRDRVARIHEAPLDAPVVEQHLAIGQRQRHAHAAHQRKPPAAAQRAQRGERRAGIGRATDEIDRRIGAAARGLTQRGDIALRIARERHGDRARSGLRNHRIECACIPPGGDHPRTTERDAEQHRGRAEVSACADHDQHVARTDPDVVQPTIGHRELAEGRQARGRQAAVRGQLGQHRRRHLRDLGEGAVGPVCLHRRRVGRDARQTDQDLRRVGRSFIRDEMRIEHDAVAGAQPVHATADRQHFGVAVRAGGEGLCRKLVRGELAGDHIGHVGQHRRRAHAQRHRPLARLRVRALLEGQRTARASQAPSLHRRSPPGDDVPIMARRRTGAARRPAVHLKPDIAALRDGIDGVFWGRRL